ncbi:MAG: hypothetical protein U1G07_20965 [Verrucomicrobiota bacterium]
MRRLEGAYKMMIMSEHELVRRAIYGARPVHQEKSATRVLATKPAHSDLIHAHFVRDVAQVKSSSCSTRTNPVASRPSGQERRAFCIFEYIYFARPDSNLSNRNVYKVRVEMGRQLARENPSMPWSCPLPDGNCAGLGYSLESNIDYQMAFCAESLAGRSFSAAVAEAG